MGVDDVRTEVARDPANRGSEGADEAGHEGRDPRIACGREEPASIGEALVSIRRVPSPHDLDRTKALAPRQTRVVRCHHGDRHAVVDLRASQVEEERRDGIVGMPWERRGDVEDPIRHRPVPYGPVMSRADGAADGAAVGAAVGAVVPRWFELAVLSAVAFVAGFGLAALALAVVGAFHVVLVIAVGLNAGLLCVLGVLRLPRRAREGRSGRSAIGAVALTVLVVGAMTGMNAWARSQHVLSTRDPGIHLITGKWLAEQSELPVDAAVGPFADSDAVDPAAALGFFPQGYPDSPSRTGPLQPQFVHLYPALIGTADWVGGNRLAQALPALMGGLALLALFVLGNRWLPPWAAAGATLAVAVSLPQAFFSRDTFSEVPVQLLVCGGLALTAWAMDGDLDRGAAALVAGLVLGAAVATRVDALVMLVALPLWMAARWIDTPARVARRLVFLGSGVAAGIALAIVDLLWRSRPYYELHRSEILSQAALFAAAVVVSWAAAWVIPRWRWLRVRISRWRRPVAAIAAFGTVALAAFAWFARPHLEKTTEVPNSLVGFLQQAEGLLVESARRYYEHSMQWLSWYLGPVTLALGILGVALAIRVVVLGRGRRTGLSLALGAFLAPTVLYLWRARAVPDQMWVMRRFLPVTIPGIALACFAVLGIMWRTRDVLLRVVAVVVGIAAVVVPALALQPVWRTSTQKGLQVATDALCASIGPDAAVVVLRDDALDQVLTQTIRSWCDVPAAGATDAFDRASARALDGRWARSGRRLVVVGSRPDAVAAVAPNLVVDIEGTNPRELEQTLTRRPSQLVTLTYRFVVGRVTAPG